MDSKNNAKTIAAMYVWSEVCGWWGLFFIISWNGHRCKNMAILLFPSSSTWAQKWCEHVQVRQPCTMIHYFGAVIHGFYSKDKEIVSQICIQSLVHALKYDHVLHFISVGHQWIMLAVNNLIIMLSMLSTCHHFLLRYMSGRYKKLWSPLYVCVVCVLTADLLNAVM